MRCLHHSVASILLAAPVFAQYCRDVLPPPSALSPGQPFGSSVAIGRGVALIGASLDDVQGTDAGAVVVYALDPGAFTTDVTQILYASDAADADWFGSRIALDGDVAVIGAGGRDSFGLMDSGAAYVFERVAGVWVEQQRLTPSAPGVSEHFGFAVDISGDRIAVGQANSCYIFRQTGGTWVEEAVLGTDGHFVSIDGTLVACPGGVYSFDVASNAWNLEFTGPQWQQVSLDGEFLALYTGALWIYIHRRDPLTGTWSHVATSSVPSATPVSIQLGDGTFTRIVGGILEVYSLESMGLIFYIVPYVPGQWLTGPVAVADGRLLATVTGYGSALLYDLRCMHSVISHNFCWQVATNSTGIAGHVDVMGSALVAANDATLTATELPPHSISMFIAGRGIFGPTMPANSQGSLCVGTSFGRFDGPGHIQSSGPFGRCELHLDLGALPTPTGPVPAAVGDSWTFQAWYRDANPGPTSNFTDLAVVTWQ